MTLRDPYPSWVFDHSPLPDPDGQGEAAVRFIRALRHHSNGRRYHLDPWQERIVRRIFGDTLPDGTRRIRHVAMLVSRGARKTGLAAVLSLLMTVQKGFRVPHGQIILAAHDHDQAKVAFEEVCGLVATHPKVNAAVRVRSNFSDVTHKASGARLRAVSSDAASQNGRTPLLAIFDEVHCWQRRDLYDIIRGGLRKKANSLSITISQAGRGQEGIAHDIFDYARKVATGEIENEAWLPILFENAADADPFDEATWRRANPGLSCTPAYPPLDEFRQMALEAKSRPPVMARFRNDHLGIWADTNDSPWLNLATWDVGAEGLLELEARSGETCWIGVDLGRTDDLTAAVACFRDPDGGFSVYPWVFAPEDQIQARTAKGDVPYGAWKDAGHLIESPGATTDYRLVKKLLVDLCDRFDVAEIAADPWNADWLLTELTEEGLPAVKHRQGYQSINEPMRALEEAVICGRLRHGGHPVLRWCIGNTIAAQDPAGNIKPNKAKSKDKIDAAVAAIMAVGRAHFNQTEKHIACNEEKRPGGLLVLGG